MTNRSSKSTEAGGETKAERRSKARFSAAREWDEKKRWKRFGFRLVGNVKGGEGGETLEEERKAYASVEWRVERRDWSAIERKKERKKAQRLAGN